MRFAVALIPLTLLFLNLGGHVPKISAQTPSVVRESNARSDGSLAVVQWRNAEVTRVLRGHNAPVSSLTFNLDGQMLISGGSLNDSHIRVWWLPRERQVDDVRAQRMRVLSLVFSPNGQYLISGGDDSGINFWQWDERRGDYERIVLEHRTNVLSLAVTPDSRVLVSGGLDGIRVWDLMTKRPLYTLVRFQPAFALQVHPNGYVLASGGGQGEVRFWNLRTGEQMGMFPAHTAQVTSLGFTADGSKLVTGGQDQMVRVWDVTTGNLLYSLSGHQGAVSAIALHPSGTLAASSSIDGVRLWDLETGELVNHLVGHQDWVGTLAFSRDGSQLATGGYDKLIKVWTVALPPEAPPTRPPVRTPLLLPDEDEALPTQDELQNVIPPKP
ncbi:WD40 repeat domain-containing protein [Spirulina subsalsa FACHB-351]|uniref:WD40 repeat domain-containing protein n=1 Tax=Spirulina subsalsa FACHB-351 TaxID=234711 RepID=A0ABT3KZX0_9CYAN|nr:WD40 repeat domain-containing protein [Spirulina subsalsa]MCW6034787.1 WD40 repeat domain-containing protein [Spirulina subsalsa FACHB-351]